MGNVFTTLEAANFAGVTPSTIRRWVKKGYLGSNSSQNVHAGAGCGYKIRQSELEKYLGWTHEEKPEPVKVKTDELVKVEPIPEIDRRSLETAANNLKIAIEFAQDELSKIIALL